MFICLSKFFQINKKHLWFHCILKCNWIKFHVFYVFNTSIYSVVFQETGDKISSWLVCLWQIWTFLSPTFSSYRLSSQKVVNKKILSPILSHQHRVKKIHTISWWLKFRVYDSIKSLYIHKLHHIPEFPF